MPLILWLLLGCTSYSGGQIALPACQEHTSKLYTSLFVHVLFKVQIRAAGSCWAPHAHQEHTGKQPYFVHLEGEPVMRMAGLFDAWKGEDGEMLYTYTILTTDSSPRLQWCAAVAAGMPGCTCWTCHKCIGRVKPVARKWRARRGAAHERALSAFLKIGSSVIAMESRFSDEIIVAAWVPGCMTACPLCCARRRTKVCGWRTASCRTSAHHAVFFFLLSPSPGCSTSASSQMASESTLNVKPCDTFCVGRQQSGRAHHVAKRGCDFRVQKRSLVLVRIVLQQVTTSTSFAGSWQLWRTRTTARTSSVTSWRRPWAS